MKNILLCRTDNIGDVVLTLPMAGYIKSCMQDVRVGFLVKSYTKPVVQLSKHVDFIIEKESLLSGETSLEKMHIDAVIFVFPDNEVAKLAFQARIPKRIGTSHRWFHWLYANTLVHFSRKRSNEHESSLNLKLVRGINLPVVPPNPIQSYYGVDLSAQNQTSKIVILHPKSKGSAREWPLKRYAELSKLLHSKGYTVYITGTASEGKRINKEMPDFFEYSHAENHIGKYDMVAFIDCISHASALVACSTGPLHIAALVGTKAIGIYPPARPMHPGRWRPLGNDVEVCVVEKENCTDCQGKKAHACACIAAIDAEQVLAKIEKNRTHI